MKPLEPPDTMFLSAALGWIDLGKPSEAAAELDHLSETSRLHPDALEVAWLAHAATQAWEPALHAARQLVDVAPDRPSGWLHQAYSLRRISNGGLEQAWEFLKSCADRFPKEATIAYNLSCYACQMGNLPGAREWLGRACQAGRRDQIRSMALNDPDLKPLWPEIKASKSEGGIC